MDTLKCYKNGNLCMHFHHTSFQDKPCLSCINNPITHLRDAYYYEEETI